jgi:hypothetical protein
MGVYFRLLIYSWDHVLDLWALILFISDLFELWGFYGFNEALPILGFYQSM